MAAEGLIIHQCMLYSGSGTCCNPLVVAKTCTRTSWCSHPKLESEGGRRAAAAAHHKLSELDTKVIEKSSKASLLYRGRLQADLLPRKVRNEDNVLFYSPVSGVCDSPTILWKLMRIPLTRSPVDLCPLVLATANTDQ